MKAVALLLLFSLTAACKRSDNNEDDVILGMNISIDFNILIKNSSGQNLLNPETPNSIVKDSVKMYYLEKGRLKEARYPYSDAPRIIFTNNFPDKEFRIKLLPFILDGKPKYNTFFIKWSTGDMDIIECEIYHAHNVCRLEKVWYNNNLTAISSKDRNIEIIK